MSAFQIESNLCTGRGFSDTAVSGFMAKFYTWITQVPASGGPGWYILYDSSTSPTGKTYTVDINTDIVTCSGHGFVSGEFVIPSTTVSTPGGLTAGTTYYANPINANTLYLHTNPNNLINGSFINISSSGTGVQTLTQKGPYIVISNVQNPQTNTPCMILKVGFDTSTGSKIIVRYYTSWNPTTKFLGGLWGGYYIDTLDSSEFVYDFRGGPETMIIQSRIGSTWDSCCIDTWTGDNNFLESATVSGVLSSGIISSSSNITVPLFSGESLNFTSGNYYYMMDFQSVKHVDYVKCVGISGLNIILQSGNYNFPSGSIIGSYPHRYFIMGTSTSSTVALSNYLTQIPYYSSNTSGYVHESNAGNTIYGAIIASYEENMITYMSPNDQGKYALEKINIVESYRANDTSSSTYTTDMNRAYGTSNNIFICKKGTMLAGSDGRTYGGKNYLYFQAADQIYNGASSSFGILFLDTESTS